MKTNEIGQDKVGLLDVNVLIALIDPAHEFHDSAHAWFKGNRRNGWATCPITENGCLRIMSKAGYPFPGLGVDRIRVILAELVQLEGHHFWPDSFSMLEANRFELGEAGPRHVTDLYLVGLAITFGGRLVTFDRTIPWRAVTGCEADDLEVLPGSVTEN
jgi:toxin-antitoxin system PIN domain toxin